MPRFHGTLVGPRVNFRRVAPSRLLEAVFAYINPCIGPEREPFSFLGVVADFFYVLSICK